MNVAYVKFECGTIIKLRLRDAFKLLNSLSREGWILENDTRRSKKKSPGIMGR